jgi:hypothetical protein
MTGLFSYVIAWYIWQRNLKYDRWLSLVIFTFSTIQWLEALLWYNLDNVQVNAFITSYLIPIVLALEPLAVLYGATFITNVDPILIILYILVIGIQLSRIGWQQTVTTVDCHNSLLWWKNPSIIYGVGFAFMLILPAFLYISDSKIKWIFISIVILALIMGYISDNDSWTSNWCLYANAFSIYALLYPYI